MRNAIHQDGDLRDLSETQAGRVAAQVTMKCTAERMHNADVPLKQAKLDRNALVNHVNCFLSGLVEGGNRLRICLKGALRHDECGELSRDIHVRRL